MKHRLAVDPIACTGHGLCAEMLPELIGLDEWGYPILADRPVPHELTALSRRAVRLCPTLALRLEAVTADRRVPTGGPQPEQAGAAGARRGGSRGSGNHSAAGTGRPAVPR